MGVGASLSMACYAPAGPGTSSSARPTTTSEPCAAELKSANMYGCNALYVMTKFCEEASGPAEIVWGPRRSPRVMFFKTSRVTCEIQTVHARPQSDPAAKKEAPPMDVPAIYVFDAGAGGGDAAPR